MEKISKILVGLFFVLSVFVIPVSATGDVYTVNVPNWGAWSSPSKKLTKSYNHTNGRMICVQSNAVLPKYGDFTAGGTKNRISKDYYLLTETTNTGNANNWAKIYYKSGQSNKGRSVSSRACSSNAEPNYNKGIFSWDTDNITG